MLLVTSVNVVLFGRPGMAEDPDDVMACKPCVQKTKERHSCPAGFEHMKTNSLNLPSLSPERVQIRDQSQGWKSSEFEVWPIGLMLFSLFTADTLNILFQVITPMFSH